MKTSLHRLGHPSHARHAVVETRPSALIGLEYVQHRILLGGPGIEHVTPTLRP
jgi:hypothetical protein